MVARPPMADVDAGSAAGFDTTSGPEASVPAEAVPEGLACCLEAATPWGPGDSVGPPSSLRALTLGTVTHIAFASLAACSPCWPKAGRSSAGGTAVEGGCHGLGGGSGDTGGNAWGGCWSGGQARSTSPVAASANATPPLSDGCRSMRLKTLPRMPRCCRDRKAMPVASTSAAATIATPTHSAKINIMGPVVLYDINDDRPSQAGRRPEGPARGLFQPPRSTPGQATDQSSESRGCTAAPPLRGVQGRGRARRTSSSLALC